MIGALRGRILSLSPEEVVIDCHGVGYRVQIPVSTYYELQGPGEGAEISLAIHTHVREDTITLFGFWTERQRALFERLITVSGIGPRLARVALSGMAPTELVAAITTGDAVRLATIPGVGKKTAERLVLELRDKLDELAGDLPPAASTTTASDDLVAALVSLGYRQAQAERTVAAVVRDHPKSDFPEQLRLALRLLARL